MSDISFEFTWFDIIVLALFVGWPGLLLGAIAGGIAWRRHRAIGAILGAIGGLAVWLGGSWALA